MIRAIRGAVHNISGREYSHIGKKRLESSISQTKSILRWFYLYKESISQKQ